MFYSLGILLAMATLLASCVNLSSKSNYESVRPGIYYQGSSPVAGGAAPPSQEDSAAASAGSGYVGDGEDYIEISGTRHITHNAQKSEASKAKPVENSFFPVSGIMDQLSKASFGYSVPKEANIDDNIEVEMIVNPSISVEQLKDQLPEGQKVGQTIQISRVIVASVSSNDFDITPITPERQVIVGDQNTTWKWSLKPKSVGPNKEVKITVSAVVTVDGERTERFLETYTGKVKVKITPGQQISRWLHDNWQWAWGSLLIPIGGFAWSVVNRKKRKKKK